MKMDEKINEMKSQLTKVLNEGKSSNKEQAVKLLEELGLDKDSALELLMAFGDKEHAKKTAENVWNAAWNSRSGVDFSTDIEKSSNAEARMTRYFNGVHSKCAFAMAINAIEPNEINDEILNQLYEQGIRENDITNPALKVTYHYYSESKEKDEQMTLKKSMDAALVDTLQNQLRRIEDKYTTLSQKYNILQSNYEKLQNSFKEKMAIAEKKYQAALVQISGLKEKVGQLQNRGIFKTIGDKLTGLFGNKKLELPETTTTLPNSLYENSAEKMGLRIPGEEDLGISYVEKNDERTTIMNRTNNDNYER